MIIRQACAAALIQCGYCERGFRRVAGIHIASQRLGMIPNTPCERVFAVHGGDSMTDLNARPWMAYVDGEPICNVRGVIRVRRFATGEAAYKAACAAAPKRWHE